MSVCASAAGRTSIQLPQLPHREGIVYGPIQSRRMGWSLGINLLGDGRRVCQFDCGYCQFPRPRFSSWSSSESSGVLRVPNILHEIEVGMRARIKSGVRFDSVSFVGNGDPSVHPDLLEIVQYTRALMHRLRMPARLSIFTNAVPYRDDLFLQALRLFDQRLIKLDASDGDTLHRIIGPHAQVDLEELVVRLALLDGVTIQTMVVRGAVDNRDSILRARYIDLVERAGATEVQLATIDKRPAVSGILPVAETELRAIARLIRRQTRVPVEVYFQDCPSGFPDARPPCYEPVTAVSCT